MKKYKAVLFDLFDTILNFDLYQLPEIYLNGKKHNSTCFDVYNIFKKHYGRITFEDFYSNYIRSYSDFQILKQQELKEYPNSKRFEILLNMLNINNFSTKLLNDMVLAHMKCLSSTISFPDENYRTIMKIKERGYMLGIISNFDHSPTAYNLLEKYSIKGLFDKIDISEDVGWRKPKDIIFKKMLDYFKINPVDAIHIGDNIKTDVLGANNVGIDSVWLRKKDEKLFNKIEPTYTINSLNELSFILLNG